MSKPDEWAAIVENAQDFMRTLRKEVHDLHEKNAQLEKDLERERDRCNAITKGYAGMRSKLDIAFGAPPGDDPERREKGRSAGLEGAIDFAIAQYAAQIRLSINGNT